jgi:outer membrane protein
MHEATLPVAAAPLAAVLLLLVSGAAAAGDVRVGVVDSQRIVLESDAGKLALSRVNALRSRLQAGVEAQRQAHEQARKDFFARAATLSQEQRGTETLRIEAMERDLERAVEDAQLQIRREGKRIQEELQKKVVAFLEAYGKEHGYTVILDRLQCLFNASDADITEDVLRAFNLAHPAS